jgi:urate oxidase
LTDIFDRNGVHVPHEVTVDTMLWGDFESSWTEGSNKKIVATDTQKNIIYGIAHSHDLSSPEEFGKAVCAHFIKTYPWITKAQVTLREEPWARINVDGKAHNHAFTKDSTEKRYAQVNDVMRTQV